MCEVTSLHASVCSTPAAGGLVVSCWKIGKRLPSVIYLQSCSLYLYVWELQFLATNSNHLNMEILISACNWPLYCLQWDNFSCTAGVNYLILWALKDKTDFFCICFAIVNKSQQNTKTNNALVLILSFPFFKGSQTAPLPQKKIQSFFLMASQSFLSNVLKEGWRVHLCWRLRIFRYGLTQSWCSSE